MPVNTETLTLAGVLASAVVVLWRKLEEKDKIILEVVRILERSAEASERSAEATMAVASAVEMLKTVLPPRKQKSTDPLNG